MNTPETVPAPRPQPRRRPPSRTRLIEIRSLPALTRCFPRNLTLITRTAQCLRQLPLAALPSTRAIPHRDVFYVAHPVRSIRRNRV